jgi:hypothetical protein
LAFAVLEGRATSVAPDPEAAGAAEPVPRMVAWSGIALRADPDAYESKLRAEEHYFRGTVLASDMIHK